MNAQANNFIFSLTELNYFGNEHAWANKQDF